jgi:hypothetical protein
LSIRFYAVVSGKEAAPKVGKERNEADKARAMTFRRGQCEDPLR